MSEPVKSIANESKPYNFQYSVCSIVNNMEQYSIMKNSFESAGFTEGCEYLIADNTTHNKYDAYCAIKMFLQQAAGKYLVIVHQDVRCIDTRTTLNACIQELNTNYPGWAVCGNAGASGYHNQIVNIAYPAKQHIYTGQLPAQVNSLDENLLIINSSTGITISSDLTGFHLYGTDLCNIAKLLGYQCFVIKFLVEHLSTGNVKEVTLYKKQFVKKYGKKIPSGFIQTTCTSFYLANSSLKNKFFNSSIIFFIIKQFKRYPYLIKNAFKNNR